MIIYEQPLNERIRLFMRLELLFHRYKYYVSNESTENVQSALILLMDIHEMTSRLDVKSAILKILDHQTTMIRGYTDNDQEQNAKNEEILDKLEEQTKALYGYHGQLGQHLKSHYVFNFIKQRASITGGLNGFDAPIFNHWISQPLEIAVEDLKEWYGPYQKLEEAILIVMDLIRNSAALEELKANDGFYQTNLSGMKNQNHQLLRVGLPASTEYYPEISAGKQRFSIRFVSTENLDERGIQIRDNVDFTLAVCGF
ncbi:MAG: FIG002842: hypothetical protein [uncultured Thiotrichaceae bacterium]|uniref:Cell division protein ZapD n=1 Tax=uncultured Thiotrichaceae bacterium TaxID=298394 RepID=A0A6S6SRH6_9GAMM|nr:MAG: FIG002842: hypothetical protein [uncultured Thiotrichaceae bacterium]